MHARTLLSLALFCGCGGDTGAAPDAGAGDAMLVEPTEPAAPAGPQLDPCPDGWRPVPPGDPDGVATCDPWPVGGPATCAPDEAHFTGEPGCTRIGAACPSDGLPADLPADEPVIYVSASAGPGGDGTRLAPHQTISLGVAFAAPDAVIAIGTGTYPEIVTIESRLTLWGACVASTVISPVTMRLDLPVVRVFGPSAEARVRNVTLAGPRPGLYVGESRPVDLDGVLFDGILGLGAQVAFMGRLTARSVLVRDTVATMGDGLGEYAVLVDGGTAELTRFVGRDLVGGGVAVLGPTSRAAIADTAMSTIRERPFDGALGVPLTVFRGAGATVSRAVFEDVRQQGVVSYGFDMPTHTDLTDVVVRRVRERASDAGRGFGIELGRGASMTASRVVLDRATGNGVFAGGFGTEVALADAVVRDTRESPTVSQGRGFEIGAGVTGVLERVRIEHNREVGILVNSAASWLSATDLTVSDTDGRQMDQAAGDGIMAQYGARIEGARVLVTRSREIGVLSTGAGTEVLLVDAAVLRTRERLCGADLCPELAAGMGITANHDGHVGLSRFDVGESALAGIQIANGGTADLFDGIVRDNPVGANVQTVDFDLARITNTVVYRDNGVNLDASSLPVPSPDTSPATLEEMMP